MRIVIKIGTSTLTHATGSLNIRRVQKLCEVVSDLKNAGHEIVLVSSGAIGMGVGKLSLKERPKDIPTKQAAAAVGQCELMYTYDKLFSSFAARSSMSCMSTASRPATSVTFTARTICRKAFALRKSASICAPRTLCNSRPCSCKRDFFQKISFLDYYFSKKD